MSAWLLRWNQLPAAGAPSGGTGGGSGPSKTAMLAYMNGLKNNSTKKYLVGQCLIYSGGLTTALANIWTPLLAQTGKYPAIMGLNGNFNNAGGALSLSDAAAAAAQQWARNGFVQFQFDVGNPISSGNATGDGGSSDNTNMSASNFHLLATPGTTIYNNWHMQLDAWAVWLTTLTSNGNIPIIKPFIELNGNWNWYGAQAYSDMIAVWRDMYNYLMVTHGLQNKIILEFNINPYQTVWSGYYPGDAYVDTLSFDIYANTAADMGSAANADGLYSGMVAKNKPVRIGEFGPKGGTGNAPNTLDDTLVLTFLNNYCPNVCAFAQWDQGLEITHQNNAYALMNDSTIITCSDIPAGMNH